MKYIILLLKIAMIIIFIMAWNKEFDSYQFYELLRWGALGTFAYFGWDSYRQNNIGWLIFFIFGAVLFNPFKHPHFDEDVWAKIDFAFAIIILISVFFDFKKTYKVPSIIKIQLDDKISKKIIAREVLIFFSAFLLLGIIRLGIGIRNTYYQDKSEESLKKIQRTQNQIDSLPTSFTWKVYNDMIPQFSEKYLVGKDTFVVHNNLKEIFLKHYPNARKLQQPQYPFLFYSDSNKLTTYTNDSA